MEEKILPEEIELSEIVLNKTNHAFEMIRQEECVVMSKKNNKKWFKSQVAAIAGICLLAASSVTAVAAVHHYWGRGMNGNIQASDVQQQQLTDKGIADIYPEKEDYEALKVVQNGVTIAPNTVIVDERFAYMSFAISGYDFEFPYYYSFLKYTIFNDACYSCPYAQNARVGDITLGDFWGIKHYNSSLDDRDGVSMLAVNSEKGEQLFALAQDSCTTYSYDLSVAAKHNQSYREPETYPLKKHEFVKILEKDGASALVRAMSCTEVKKNLLWARMPDNVKRIYQKNE